MSVKTILISQFPLPYHKIGSWTTMYNYYLNSNNNKIDYIFCPKPNKIADTVTYSFIDANKFEKVNIKLTKNKYLVLFSKLETILNSSEKYIIQVVDNHGLVFDLNKFLIEKGIRDKCYIQFFYHGYSPFYDSFTGGQFFEAIDEHIMLTQKSYEYYKHFYAVTPCVFSILPNGVNSKLFFIDKKTNKQDTITFTWCSQDRPKKGLDFILKVWKLLIKKHKNIELQIIGVEREINVPQVKVIGRVPNNKIPKFYQQSDFYLFPTLCHEGFGLTLAEALKCGCYCIASNYGGVPEVLANGAYGKLIKNPNIIEEWLEEIDKSIEEYKSNNFQNPYIKNLPKDLYSLENWSENMNNLIARAKLLLE